MALSEESRRFIERICVEDQDWADHTLRWLDGRQVPYGEEGASFPTLIAYAMSVKLNSVERLAKLRAGDASFDLFR